MVSSAGLVPKTASKSINVKRKKNEFEFSQEVFSVDDICEILSISNATAKNWIRLGKITPDIEGCLFSRKYIENFIFLLKSNGDTRLKSRRNKKNVTGKILYKDYVHTSSNQRLVEELLDLKIIQSENDLLVTLANFAVQLYYQSRGIHYSENNVLLDFLSKNFSDDFHILIKDLLGKNTIDYVAKNKLEPVLSKRILFVKGEDTLGFVYISLQDIGYRKCSGAYYTPEKIVKKVIDQLYDNDSNLNLRTICDPCCGTGNFLLSLMAKGINPTNIYGQDIDHISVYLCRINIALMAPQMSAAELRSRIIIGNTYFETFNIKFDVVLGNPPWGSVFSNDDALKCRNLFKTAIGKNIESSDLFVEKALSMLRQNGILAFVLPESILSVATHNAARKMILDSCSFKFVSYLGNVFSGVLCPSIIIGITMDDCRTAIGCKVTTNNKSFVISQEREFDHNTLLFNVSDKENECLRAISSIDNVAYLKGNAIFALGIVTGNNKEYVSGEKHEGYEIILKGNDILKYGIKASGNYILFMPESFQQVAPVEIYRAKEKLLYRFISEMPVFAYDDQQTLSLNSCNIVIPKIAGLDMKYVLAILNSSVAAYFISKKFNSVKLLRSHIEQMPIPVVESNTQTAIIKKVNCIMNASENISGLYADLDNDIMELFGLSSEQIKTIQTALTGKNLFLTTP